MYNGLLQQDVSGPRARAAINKLKLLTFYFSDSFIYIFNFFWASKPWLKNSQVEGDSEKVGNKGSATRKKGSMAQKWSTQPSTRPEKDLLHLNQLNKHLNGTTDALIASHCLSVKRRFPSSRWRDEVGSGHLFPPSPPALSALPPLAGTRGEAFCPTRGCGLTWAHLPTESVRSLRWEHGPCLTAHGPCAHLTCRMLYDLPWGASDACVLTKFGAQRRKNWMSLASLHSLD